MGLGKLGGLSHVFNLIVGSLIGLPEDLSVFSLTVGNLV